MSATRRDCFIWSLTNTLSLDNEGDKVGHHGGYDHGDDEADSNDDEHDYKDHLGGDGALQKGVKKLDKSC